MFLSSLAQSLLIWPFQCLQASTPHTGYWQALGKYSSSFDLHLHCWPCSIVLRHVSALLCVRNLLIAPLANTCRPSTEALTYGHIPQCSVGWEGS